MIKLLLVGLGGFAGSIARFGLGGLVQDRSGATFPFGTLAVNVLIASDTGAVVDRRCGAFVQRPTGVLDSRTVCVVGPDGRMAFRVSPFREVDPTSYTDLGAAIARLVMADSTRGI